MAEFAFLSQLEGLDEDSAQDRASRYEATYPPADGPQIDGDPLDLALIDFRRRLYVSPDNKVWSVGQGMTAWTDPRVSGVRKSWTKNTFLLDRKDREKWASTLRMSFKKDETGQPLVDAATGQKIPAEPPEWDRMVLNMTPDEVARLGGPDSPAVADVLRQWVDQVRRGPGGVGIRAVEIEPFHTDGAMFHLHVTVSRMPYDVGRKAALATVFQPSVHAKEGERIAAGMTLLPTDYRKPLGPTDVTPAVVASVVEQQRAAGITSRPEMEGGAISKKWEPVASGAAPTDEASPLVKAFGSIDRAVVRRQQEIEDYLAIQRGLQEAAAFHHQVADMKVTVAELKDHVAKEPERVHAAVEGAVEAARSLWDAQVLEPVSTALEAEKLKVAELQTVVEGEDARTKAVVKPVQDRLLDAELARTVESQRADTERDRAEAAEALAASHAATIADEPKRTEVAVAAATAPLNAELVEMRAKLEASETARMTAVAELAEEKRTFKDRVKDAIKVAVDEARADWDKTVLQPLRDERDSLKADVASLKAEIAELKREMAGMMELVKDALRRVAAAPAAMVADAAAGVTRVLDRVADTAAAATVKADETAARIEGSQAATRKRAGRNYDSVPPEQWNDDQAAFAEDRLARLKRTGGPDVQDMTIEQFGAAAHKAWAAKQKGPDAPEDTPADKRKPK